MSHDHPSRTVTQLEGVISRSDSASLIIQMETHLHALFDRPGPCIGTRTKLYWAPTPLYHKTFSFKSKRLLSF